MEKKTQEPQSANSSLQHSIDQLCSLQPNTQVLVASLISRLAKAEGVSISIDHKLNGAVERAHRTHTEEFYEVTESSFDLSELREELLEWEQVYNTVRPHQALGYVTPLKFLEQRKEYSGKEAMCH